MQEMMNRRLTPVAWATGAAVVALAIGGFALSFNALRDLATGSGIPTELAYIWPLIVDGFIIVATAATFTLKNTNRRVTWYPWTALVVFSGISVTGIALHALNTGTGLRVPVLVAAAVSAVPAIALLIASHLLILMLGHATTPSATTATIPVELELELETIPPSVPTASSLSTVMAQQSLPTAGPEHAAGGGKAALAAWLATHPDPDTVTGRIAAEHVGVPLTTAKRWLTQLRRETPEPRRRTA